MYRIKCTQFNIQQNIMETYLGNRTEISQIRDTLIACDFSLKKVA